MSSALAGIATEIVAAATAAITRCFIIACSSWIQLSATQFAKT
jgi:hypothetical protein